MIVAEYIKLTKDLVMLTDIPIKLNSSITRNLLTTCITDTRTGPLTNQKQLTLNINLMPQEKATSIILKETLRLIAIDMISVMVIKDQEAMVIQDMVATDHPTTTPTIDLA